MRSTTLLSLLAFIPAITAHITMFEPKQWNVPEVIRATVETSDGNLNPLQHDGSNFPCHGVAPEGPVATYLPGTSQSLKLKGSAVHAGGSGQMVITYDTTPKKNTVFRVMTSYMGDHPIKASGNLGPTDRDPQGLKSELELWKLNPLSFTVPKGLPKGTAVVAWTWFNHMGNREMYMQCATVVIGGEETSMDAFMKLPGMFKANIGGGCTISDQISAIDFKNPGPEVFGKGITPVPCGEPADTGAGGGGSSGSSGPEVKPGVSSVALSPTSDSNRTYPSPTAPAAGGDAGGAGDDRVSTTYLTVTPTPSNLANFQTSLPSAPTTLPESTILSPAPSKTDAPATAELEPCTVEGQITCGENSTWYMCASGRKQFMGPLAAGTNCTAGKIAKRGVRGFYF
ncbi:hypothetical protein L873DRAFT_1814202 [Choiromyces venosus 120613-1]|uniref:Lytic polysaccharide monooxygenase n=1 Tax=Choiromyces venosus 120613-1 TaxID=1336337 RepID=A0A3N4JDW2_9PEZI|nr:hypothetical protein L873DRAFT_1814202 [Choiromyces venosus 120613-1]